MEVPLVVKANWLTQKIPREVYPKTLVLILLLVVGALFYFGNYLGATEWMPASGERVFKEHEYWRLWTTLFAHGDLGHILGNLFLFIPFAYFLTGHFGAAFFPLLGFFVGGIINFFVLKTMPEHISLIGASGVVYWMGGAWMTLAFLIDRRESWGRRMIKVMGVSMVLFLPDSFRANVSYMAHFIGLIFGVLSALGLYAFKRRTYLAAEILEEVREPALEEDEFPFDDDFYV